MPFSGSLLWRRKLEISGFLSTSGDVSTTAFLNRTVTGQLDNLTGDLSTRVFYKRSLAGTLTFTGTNSPAYVQLASTAGILQNFSGAISAVLSKGTADLRKWLFPWKGNPWGKKPWGSKYW